MTTTTLQQEQKKSIIPFLKWAGGKRWLSEHVLSLIPENYGTYFEPFLGSGAIFFSLQPRTAVLSDLNPSLINTYESIRSNSDLVTRELRKHHRRHNKNYYYEIRNKRLRAQHTQAAQFIYLNRTCWNGLYRVNLAGDFNVPIGTKNNVIMDTDDFHAIGKSLQNADLHCQDFEKTIDMAQENDIIFADPPYTIHHNHNGFIKYNENIFSWQDQIRLRDALIRATNRGAKAIVTNANHESVRELYRTGFALDSVSRVSVIAGNATARKSFDELLIVSL
ncbi:Dam family site-specific DNA-(adenine-N6)-methyltransferase [Burkholderia pseudomallei]|uniref:DNA adenine methylase n=1 Tax=Burkholderia pseudomallei TaxID=28450 RepID=UPI001AD7098B|nr:Dam family site-specific DNA-(adenine-N6)-methyltransferase [Burkholderia pseudomallei]MBO7771593.1 Dam family site-specific DNA-(adenine-N6)-methyltransferase [Burkholderia pseudomallei]MBO7905636.1 Dam family site-specific DNA-(adenine-N6)-methyltransferase [Burkholderia pseudomallei]